MEVSLQSFNFDAETNTNNTEEVVNAGGDGIVLEANTISTGIFLLVGTYQT